jgi:hypothetical protein
MGVNEVGRKEKAGMDYSKALICSSYLLLNVDDVQ